MIIKQSCIGDTTTRNTTPEPLISHHKNFKCVIDEIRTAIQRSWTLPRHIGIVDPNVCVPAVILCATGFAHRPLYVGLHSSNYVSPWLHCWCSRVENKESHPTAQYKRCNGIKHQTPNHLKHKQKFPINRRQTIVSLVLLTRSHWQCEWQRVSNGHHQRRALAR